MTAPIIRKYRFLNTPRLVAGMNASRGDRDVRGQVKKDHQYTLWWSGVLGADWTLLNMINQLGSDTLRSPQIDLRDYDADDFRSGFLKIQTSPL